MILRVLFVEDSEDDALLVVHELEQGGFQVTYKRVETGAEMTAALGQENWDVVICDYVLPRFSVPEALRLMKVQGLDLPLLVVSGQMGEETAVECMRAGSRDFIRKDRLDRLIPVIEREMQESRMRLAKEEALQLRERQLRELLDNSPVALALTNQEGNIEFFNKKFFTIFGYSREDIPHMKDWWSLAYPDASYRQQVMDSWSQAMNQASTTGEEISPGERQVTCKNGEVRTIEITGKSIGDKILFSFSDITQWKRAEERNRRQAREMEALYGIAATLNSPLKLEEMLQGTLAQLKEQLFPTPGGTIVFLKDSLNDKLYPAAHHGVPDSHSCLVAPLTVGECLCGLAVQCREVLVSHYGWEDSQRSRQCPGLSRHNDLCLPLKVSQEVLGVIHLDLPPDMVLAHHDLKLLRSVTDQISLAVARFRLYEEVNRQRKELHQLTAQIAETEETERQRLSRELHDQVGQNLTALGINLGMMQSLLTQKAVEPIFACLADSIETLKQISNLVRDIMADLRPPALDDYGLMAALRGYGAQFAKRTGIAVEITGSDGLPRLDSLKEITLFRIAQEAMTNVAKHAGATRITLTPEMENDMVRLIIADNGIGFAPERLTAPVANRGWGLMTMKERAAAARGRCRIISRPGEGARVVVEMSL